MVLLVLPKNTNKISPLDVVEGTSHNSLHGHPEEGSHHSPPVEDESRKIMSSPSPVMQQTIVDLCLRVAATFTADEVPSLVEKWLGLGPVESSLAPFNGVLQSLLDPSSIFYQTNTGNANIVVNVVLARLSDLRPTGPRGTTSGSTSKAEENPTVQELGEALQHYQQSKATVPLVVVICPEKDPPGVDGTSTSARKLQALGQNWSKILLVDAEEEVVQPLIGRGSRAEGDRALDSRTDLFDPVSEELGALPYSLQGFDALGYLVARCVSFVVRPPLKVVFVDCDNTLWEGQAGDSADAPRLVEPNESLQKKLANLKRQGVLLVALSKNTLEDVETAFAAHPDWPLGVEDFILKKINWEAKSENIKRACEELNLTLNSSMVFLDDNPVEVAEVRNALVGSGVVSIGVPPFRISERVENECFVGNLWNLDSFKRYQQGTPGAEEMDKTEQYRLEFERRAAASETTNFADFIQKLELEITIEVCSAKDEARVLELTQKSNQFNFTTERLLAMPSPDEQLECHVVRVKDRFGDYGLVGILFFRRVSEEKVELDNLLMSCRVLGRGVEHRMLNWLAQQTTGKVEIVFVESGRNLPARKFLEGVGLWVGEGAGEAAGGRKEFDAKMLAAIVFDPANVNTYGATGVQQPTGPENKDAVGKSLADVDYQKVAEKRSKVEVDFQKGPKGVSLGVVSQEKVALTQDKFREICHLCIGEVLGSEILKAVQELGGDERSLTTLGMDSLLVVRCVGVLSKLLSEVIGKNVSLIKHVDNFQRNPSVGDWVGFLESAAKEAQGGGTNGTNGAAQAWNKRPPLRHSDVMFRVQKGTDPSKAPIVFIHPAGGATKPFHKVWTALGLERDLWAIEHPFMTRPEYDPEDKLTKLNIGTLGAAYREAISANLELEKNPTKKWVLCTYSAGGIYLNEAYHHLAMHHERPSIQEFGKGCDIR